MRGWTPLFLLAALMVVVCGCMEPGRSQVMNWKNVNVYVCTAPEGALAEGTLRTNEVAAAGSRGGIAGSELGDMLSMNMMLEHSGGAESDSRSYGNPQVPMGDSALGALGRFAGGAVKGLTDDDDDEKAAEAEADVP